MNDKQRIKQLEEALASSNASNVDKDAELAKAKKEADEARNNVESPCGFFELWSETSGSFRREYTVEWLLEKAEMAKQNDGIIGMRYQLQEATSQTAGTMASLQVFDSFCVTYEADNAEKEKRNISYRNEQFSKNVGGRNIWKNKPKEKVAVNQ